MDDGALTARRASGPDGDGGRQGLGPEDPKADRTAQPGHCLHDLWNPRAFGLGREPRDEPSHREPARGRSQEAEPPGNRRQTLQGEFTHPEGAGLDDADEVAESDGAVSDKYADDRRRDDDKGVLSPSNVGQEPIQPFTKSLAKPEEADRGGARPPARPSAPGGSWLGHGLIWEAQAHRPHVLRRVCPGVRRPRVSAS